MNKILGREPAVLFALVAGVLLALLQLWPMPTEVNGALNALVLAAAGVATAIAVASDKVLPALVGLVQATFALFLSLGTPVPETTQTGILALLAAVAGFFVRQSVDAKLDSGWTVKLNAAFDSGYQTSQDDALHDITAKPSRVQFGPRTSGAHGLTETMPRVGDIYDQDKDDTR